MLPSGRGAILKAAVSAGTLTDSATGVICRFANCQQRFCRQLGHDRDFRPTACRWRHAAAFRSSSPVSASPHGSDRHLAAEGAAKPITRFSIASEAAHPHQVVDCIVVVSNELASDMSAAALRA